MKLFFSILLFISAYFITYPAKNGINTNLGYIWKRECCNEEYQFPVLIVLPIIFLIGFVAGMVGISGGGLIVPLLVTLGAMLLRIAFATNSIMVLFASGMGFLGHGIRSGVNWEFTLTMAAFVAAGAVLGANLSGRVKIENLKKIFVWVLVIAASWMIVKIYI